MTRIRLALPVSFLLVSLTLPSIGQTSDDTRKEAFVPPMQTQSQVSTATAKPAEHQITALGLALKYYEKAVKANPKYADAENNIGTIWYQRKKFGKAVRAYQKAIKMRDDMPVLYSNLGYAYFSQGKYDDSIVAFRTALAKDPQFFERGSSRNGSVLQDRSVPDRGRFYFL